MSKELLLELRDVCLRHTPDGAPAIDGVSFTLQRGEILGLAGESGGGKSTLARAIAGLHALARGEIRFQGLRISERAVYLKHRRELCRKLQLVFQDSDAALNPRMTAHDCVAEPLVVQRLAAGSALDERVAALLQAVGLDARCSALYPGELSGGQRQRVAVARALALDPVLLVADEPFASQDASLQAQLANLFLRLRQQRGLTLLLVAHDLSLLRLLSDRIGVLCGGKLVELAPTDSLFAHPAHPYTQALLSAMPLPDPHRERCRVLLPFDRSAFPDGPLIKIAPAHYARVGAPCDFVRSPTQTKEDEPDEKSQDHRAQDDAG